MSSNTNFQTVSPFNIALVKKAHKGLAGTVNPSA